MDLSRHPDNWDGSTLYADDLTVGEVFDLGSHTVTTEELVDFAGTWDPQFFHVDEEAGDTRAVRRAHRQRHPHDGGLPAPVGGGFWYRSATIAARGIREVRFLSPMRPGTTITGRMVVEEVRHRDADARWSPCRARSTRRPASRSWR